MMVTGVRHQFLTAIDHFPQGSRECRIYEAWAFNQTDIPRLRKPIRNWRGTVADPAILYQE